MERDGDHRLMDEIVLDSENKQSLEETAEDDFESEASTDPVDNMRKRKNASGVWMFATKTKDGATCGICGVFKPNKYGSTTAIISHILNKHKGSEEAKSLEKSIEEKSIAEAAEKKKKEDKAAKQSSLLNFVKRSGTITKAKKEKIDDALTEYIVGNNESFATAENPFLRKLLSIADPDYTAPSASTVARSIDKKASDVKKKLRDKIVSDVEKAGHKTISVTVDGGTSKGRRKTKKNAVTVHRTTKGFKLKNDTLAMIKICGWKDDWTVNWTTDGAAVMVSARRHGAHPQVVG